MTIIKSCQHIDSLTQKIPKIRYLVNACLFALLTAFFILPENGLANNTLTLTDEDIGNINLDNFLEFYDPGLQKPDINTITELDDHKWRSLKRYHRH